VGKESRADRLHDSAFRFGEGLGELGRGVEGKAEIVGWAGWEEGREINARWVEGRTVWDNALSVQSICDRSGERLSTTGFVF
jgi:hypothetical protein